MKYFNRHKYKIVVTSPENLEKFRQSHPEFKKYSDRQLGKFWKALYTEATDELLKNVAGIDLPLYLGNLSIKTLDIDFKGHLDIPHSSYNKRLQYKGFIHTSQRMKVVWKKHLLFKSFCNQMGMEVCKYTKTKVSSSVRGKENYYQKAYKHDKIPSKHTEIPVEKSLFDSA